MTRARSLRSLAVSATLLLASAAAPAGSAPAAELSGRVTLAKSAGGRTQQMSEPAPANCAYGAGYWPNPTVLDICMRPRRLDSDVKKEVSADV